MRRKESIRIWLSMGLVLVLSGGAVPALAVDETDSRVTSDPLEAMNRGIFWFNVELLDRFLLHPAAIAWDTVLPDSVERSIRNVRAGFSIVSSTRPSSPVTIRSPG